MDVARICSSLNAFAHEAWVWLAGAATKDPAAWLSFGTTTILGLVTIYFASRAHALTSMQIAAQYLDWDERLSRAAAEINKANTFVWFWLNLYGEASLVERRNRYAETHWHFEEVSVDAVRSILFHLLPSRANDGVAGLSQVSGAKAALAGSIHAVNLQWTEGTGSSKADELLKSCDDLVRAAQPLLIAVSSAIEEKREELAKNAARLSR